MPQTISGRTERMSQGNKKNRRPTEHRSANPQRDQNEAENVAME